MSWFKTHQEFLWKFGIKWTPRLTRSESEQERKVHTATSRSNPDLAPNGYFGILRIFDFTQPTDRF